MIPPTTDETKVERGRVRQLFRFLKDFNAVKNPFKRLITEQPWLLWFRDLPTHPDVWLRGRDDETPRAAGDAPGALLRIRRPEIPKPPTLPPILVGWVPRRWSDPSEKIEPLAEMQIRQPNGETQTQKFNDNPERAIVWLHFRKERGDWAPRALLALKVLGVFNRLFELQGKIDREGEALQLVFGEGMLVWQRQDGDIRHPLIAQRLQLLFDPQIPEFTLAESELPPELLRPLLMADHPGATQATQQLDDELTEDRHDLLDRNHLAGPLGRLAAALHEGGRFISAPATELTSAPQIYCDPVVYLSKRSQGFGAALDYVLQDIQDRTDFPGGLLRIAGIRPTMPDIPGESARAAWQEPEEVLFTKDANEQQAQIAERLGKHGNVLVQGPPGTGKTHTIANLIGHLLAQGKRVLVTAQTSKALRVVREKVVEDLQTLCVSVLDNDTESRRELEASVDAMVARLSADDAVQLEREASSAESQRRVLLADLSSLQRALIDARSDEYRDIRTGDVNLSPSAAARLVAEGAQHHAWIPGLVTPGVAHPLATDELSALYSTNVLIPAECELDLTRWRPLPGDVPGAQEFETQSLRWAVLHDHSDLTTGAQWWGDSIYDASQDDLNRLASRVRESVVLLESSPLWKLDAVAAGVSTRPQLGAAWTDLIAKCESLQTEADSHRNLLLDVRCVVDPSLAGDECLRLAHEIRQYVMAGGSLSQMRLWTKPIWRRFFSVVNVNGRQPRSADDFAALEAFAALRAARESLAIRWSNQVSSRGGPPWTVFGDQPENEIGTLMDQVRALISWHDRQLLPIARELSLAGFAWEGFLASQDVVPGEHTEVRRLVAAVTVALPPMVAARINRLQLAALDKQFTRWHSSLFSPDPAALPASPVIDLRRALIQKDVTTYQTASRRLEVLHALSPLYETRVRTLATLKTAAPSWARAIEDRVGIHAAGEVPGLVGEAWRWLQCRQELERRGRVSMAELQAKIHDVRARLRATTATLIERRAWAAQCRRVGLEDQQALQGWKDIIRKIGRGTGQRAAGLRVEARRTLAKARNAVPVWIMPLSRVAETLDPRGARFDVVIVDESSQCDVLGLLALYLAKDAIVVGDHEQVSPLAIGQQIAEVVRLIDQHLGGIPNNALYDGKTSLYDLARQSFGGMIRLVEHFRCLPEIIAFSNHLSYDGTIKPLRDQSTATLGQAVVSLAVSGIREGRKVNRVEAESVVALIEAAIELPAYDGKTFGVVSLLGEEQAVEIESLVRERISPQRMAGRNFLCGTAAQFQGDERDVVWLSMVDSPKEGPLTLHAADLYRQRFNVAASRAKDQLWVVHSLDPRRDLQPTDLRRRLIEHAENPRALTDAHLAGLQETESEFERLVLQALTTEGFRVKPQWRVGAYRIDLVVEGGGRRLAVECDGDRFHPIETIAADMARQAVLERLGWRFVRIRGSHFFRDPREAMKPVFETLLLLGIQPEREQQPPRIEDDGVELIKRRASEIVQTYKADLQSPPDDVSMGDVAAV